MKYITECLNPCELGSLQRIQHSFPGQTKFNVPYTKLQHPWGFLRSADHKLLSPNQTSRNAYSKTVVQAAATMQGDFHNPCVLCFLCKARAGEGSVTCSILLSIQSRCLLAQGTLILKPPSSQHLFQVVTYKLLFSGTHLLITVLYIVIYTHQ